MSLSDRVVTMHRVKGLEFRRGIIAATNAGTLPLGTAAGVSEDHTIRAESDSRERALPSVAATRAREDLIVTWFGKPSGWLGVS